VSSEPPPPEVAALIAAAADAVWPRPAAPVAAPDHRAWRFSGRWWHRPVVARRERP
jgi:hypothetical protein